MTLIKRFWYIRDGHIINVNFMVQYKWDSYSIIKDKNKYHMYLHNEL